MPVDNPLMHVGGMPVPLPLLPLPLLLPPPVPLPPLPLLEPGLPDAAPDPLLLPLLGAPTKQTEWQDASSQP